MSSIYFQVRLALREQLSNAIQLASFTLLRDLENRLKWDSIKLATYQREFKGLRLNLWVAVPLPTRKPKPVEPERYMLYIIIYYKHIYYVYILLLDWACTA